MVAFQSDLSSLEQLSKHAQDLEKMKNLEESHSPNSNNNGKSNANSIEKAYSPTTNNNEKSNVNTIEKSHSPTAFNSLFALTGQLVADAMRDENEELEALLLEIVRPEQIVRRLPLGNTFILTGVTPRQAQLIADLPRTAILTLSLFKRIRDSDSPQLKLKSMPPKGPFDDEPITGPIQSFNPHEKGKS